MQAEGLSDYDHERLNQHLLDKCSKEELARIGFAEKLTAWLIEERKTFGPDQAAFCASVAFATARRIFEDMPRRIDC
jgi:hypothetical protein